MSMSMSKSQSKSQRKNAWRARRREALRMEQCTSIASTDIATTNASADIATSSEKNVMTTWALAVIKWYCSLWQWSKTTPHMTRHKQRRFKSLFFFSSNYKGIFDQWFKLGRFCYSIAGIHKNTTDGYGIFKETNRVVYDFMDPTLGRYVLTASGSFYRLMDHNYKGTKEEFSVEQEKRSDFIQFVFLHGSPPRKPV